MAIVQSHQATVTPTHSSTTTQQLGNSEKTPFTPPKLTFITPKLTKQGSVEKLTALGAGIGTFS